MIETSSAADRMDEQFCENCGSPAGPQLSLTRTGLVTCPACGIHACKRCWARSVGFCPACIASISTAPSAEVPPVPAASTPGPRSARRPLLALAAAGGAFVLAATVFAFGFVTPPGPTGGVAGITGTPEVSATDGFGFGAPATPDTEGTDPPASDGTGDGSDRTARPGAVQPPAPSPTPEPPAAPTPKEIEPPAPTPAPDHDSDTGADARPHRDSDTRADAESDPEAHARTDRHADAGAVRMHRNGTESRLASTGATPTGCGPRRASPATSPRSPARGTT